MCKEILTFGNTEIEENKFYCKTPIFLGDIDTADIKKESDSELFYSKDYLKTKIKSHGREVTDFYDVKIPKLVSNHTCLAVISLDSALKKDDTYHLQVLLQECKYIEKKLVRYIHDNLCDFSYSSD